MHATLPRLEVTDFPAIHRKRLDTLQVNLGYKCNQTCLHCHVNAGPTRTEMMGRETISDVIAFLKASRVKILDLTGGAPELNTHFRGLVLAARNLGAHVMDRCNLTILEQPGQDDLAQFLAANAVEIVASLPCYLEENVDAQRGKGVFEASIRALRTLNALGYGRAGSGLALNLVYNPQGPTLPPAQDKLEADYHRHLAERFTDQAQEAGLVVWPNVGQADGVNGDLVCLAPPFVVTDAELEEMIRRFGQALDSTLDQLSTQ